MGGADAISKVADIVSGIEGGRAVVVSATSGTTDTLIELGHMALKNGQWERELRELMDSHDKIVSKLGLELDLGGFWMDTKNILQGVSLIMELSPSAYDRLITVGERVSSTILAALLESRDVRAEMLDAHEFIFTDDGYGDANVDFEKTNVAVIATMVEMIKEGVTPIVTGFTGQSPSGHYTTLGRGGSDYTAAILGAAMDASEVQIWTDVDGIFNTDPRLVSEANVLPQLSFNEAGELAYFGAKVLHPKTIRPAIDKDIPVRILNTFNPEAPGTVITNEESESLKSVTYKKGIRIVNICSARMLDSHGFLEKIFEIFARHEVVVDVVSTSEVSVSVTIDNGFPEEALEELEKFATVTIIDEMSIICLVGSGIKSSSGVLASLFGAIEGHNVEMVSVGASKRNITFLVKEAEAKEVVTKVFNTFFNN